MKKTVQSILVAAVLFASRLAGDAQDCDLITHPVTDVGERKLIDEQITIQSPTFPIQTADARHIRIRLQIDNDVDCKWYVSIRDYQFRLIQTLSSNDFLASRSRWSERITGPAAIVVLEPCQDGRTAAIIVKEYTVVSKSAIRPYYSLQNPQLPLFRDLYSDPVNRYLRGVGDSVGFMVSSWDRQVWTCSGVMIARDLFLTNWHCGAPSTTFPVEGYWNEQILRDMVVDISWDGDAVSRDFSAVKLIDQNADLDFALVRVTPLNFSGELKPARISLIPPKVNTQLEVIHHPAAMQKQISYACSVANDRYPSWREAVQDVDFTHRCDTEHGSSGAPVYDSDGRVIGLHHLGFDIDPKSCKQKDTLNKAVRIDKIIDYLRNKNPVIIQELILLSK